MDQDGVDKRWCDRDGVNRDGSIERIRDESRWREFEMIYIRDGVDRDGVAGWCGSVRVGSWEGCSILKLLYEREQIAMHAFMLSSRE